MKIAPAFPVSEEQQWVIDHLRDGVNVVVDACAGSGKSTTILSTALAFPKKRFLHFTYNRMLKREFKDKIHELGIPNVDVFTFHSFAVKYFTPTANTDTGIRTLLRDQLPVQGTDTAVHGVLPTYDVVVLDESQDMTLLYYRFIRYLLPLICQRRRPGPHHRVQLLVLGDYMQGLYEFMGSDVRFLTLAPDMWKGCPHLKSPEFRRCTLQMSYRITRPMAQFVNHVMLDRPRIEACRDGVPVQYIRRRRDEIERIVIHLIRKIIDEGDLYSDIFVLAPSVKGINSKVRKLENALSECGIPCHVPMRENENIDDERVIDGKVVFSTFNTAKGRQRKYVFVMGFDHSYFVHYAKDFPPDVCPNTLYVGCTRATHQLYLLECNGSYYDRPLPFLRLSHVEMNQTDYIDFKGMPQSIFPPFEPEDPIDEKGRQVTPTDLIRFLPEEVIETVTPLLERLYVTLQPASPILKTDGGDDCIPSVVCFSDRFYEDVSDLNGIALPCMYWDHIQKEVQTQEPNMLYRLIASAIRDMKDGEHMYLKQLFRELDPVCRTAADYLYMANLWKAVQEKLYYKLKQISQSVGSASYTWISDDMVDHCHQCMDATIGCEQVEAHEITLIQYQMVDEHAPIDQALAAHLGEGVHYRFSARADLITQESLWEIKCVHQLTLDHQLQLVMYAWLWALTRPEGVQKKMKLFNLKTGEVQELTGSVDDWTEIIVHLLKGKYQKRTPLTDEEFVAQSEKTV